MNVDNLTSKTRRHVKRIARRFLGRSPDPLPLTSVYEEFGDVEWTQIVPEETHPTPELLDWNLAPFFQHLGQPSYTAPALRCAVLPDVLFCPHNNVVYTQNREVLAETTGPGARGAHIDWSMFGDGRPSDGISGYATALRCPFTNHYHFLIDNLPRLLLLHHPFFQTLSDIKILCPGGTSQKETYFLSRILPSNASIKVLQEDPRYHIENYLFIPFLTTQGSGYLHRPAIRLFRKTLDLTDFGNQKRIYVSRSKADSRHVANESELIPGLEDRGFQRYHLEDMSIEQQIDLFRQANCVVGSHGAGLANMLFADSANILELFGAGKIATHYYTLSKSLRHKYNTLILCSGDNFYDDFQVDTNKLFQEIDKLI